MIKGLAIAAAIGALGFVQAAHAADFAIRASHAEATESLLLEG